MYKQIYLCNFKQHFKNHIPYSITPRKKWENAIISKKYCRYCEICSYIINRTFWINITTVCNTRTLAHMNHTHVTSYEATFTPPATLRTRGWNDSKVNSIQLVFPCNFAPKLAIGPARVISVILFFGWLLSGDFVGNCVTVVV